MFGVTILGNNSALPAYNRHPTAQVVTMNEHLFLIDCGEGTQMQMSKYKIKRSRINHIFISHLHGDHYFGLAGLITSMGLFGREQDLHIFSPNGLQQIIQLQIQVANMALPFKLIFHTIENEGILIEEEKFRVKCFAVQHRIPCWGFIFQEIKKPRKVNNEAAIQHQIPAAFYNQLKEGKDYINKLGETIANELVTIANTAAASYAFCADTVYLPSIAEKLQKVSTIYHEATYLKDLKERALLRFHSTTEDAANIALQANTKRLLIGHFSSKYEDLSPFLAEAQAIFSNTELALEGTTFEITA